MWDCNEDVTVLYEFEVIKKLGQEYTKLVIICKDKNSYYLRIHSIMPNKFCGKYFLFSHNRRVHTKVGEASFARKCTKIKAREGHWMW